MEITFISKTCKNNKSLMITIPSVIVQKYNLKKGEIINFKVEVKE